MTCDPNLCPYPKTCHYKISSGAVKVIKENFSDLLLRIETASNKLRVGHESTQKKSPMRPCMLLSLPIPACRMHELTHITLQTLTYADGRDYHRTRHRCILPVIKIEVLVKFCAVGSTDALTCRIDYRDLSNSLKTYRDTQPSRKGS